MEEIKVSEMLQADSINKDDSVMIIQEGVNKKASGSIQTATGTSLSLTSVADTCKVKSNSKNLVNPDTLLIGYQIDGAGAIAVNSNRAVTDYIEVKPETSYVVSGCTPKVTVFYDSTKTLISTATNVTTYTTPADTKYIRYGIDITADYSQMQLEEGNTATEYNPYSTKVSINNSIYGGSFAVGDWMVTTGEPRVTSGRIRCAEKLQVEPNTEYIFDTELGNIVRFVLFYDESETYLNTYIDIKANNGHFTTSNNTKYITFYVISTTATTYDNYVIVEATKKASMQSIALIPQEEKVAFTYDTETNILSDGSVTITYNTKGRVLNNNDTTAIKEYVDRETEEIYSTEETKIGTFMGKPLYRKVFVINATIPSNSASSGGSVTIFNKSTYNADEVFIQSCRVDNSDNSVSIYVPYAGGQPRYIGISRISNNINVSFYNAFSNENVKITSIIEYTKTTDA